MQIAGRPILHSDDALLDAAASVFEAQGFHAASMVDLAQAAGASKPTLYARFGTKEQLYDRVLSRAAQSLIDGLAVHLRDADGVDAEAASRLLAEAFFGWVRSHPAAFRLLFAGSVAPTGVDHRERALAALREVVTTANERFLRRAGRRPGRATPLVAAYFVGVLQQGGLWALENEDFDVADFTARFILGGLERVG